MRSKHSLLVAILLLATGARASPVTYNIVIDSTPLGVGTGSLDFNFEPGPFNAQPATVQILGFGGNGVPVGGASLTGDATGSLPGTLQLNNSTGFNDYFQTFTFGSTLFFQIALSGPALDPPDGTLSGSTFALSIFSDTQGTTPALTTDIEDGYAVTVNIDPSGSTSLVNYTASAVPEPPTVLLVAGPMLLFLSRLSLWRSKMKREKSV